MAKGVVRAGITFTGPVIRAAQVNTDGQFMALLPAGTYSVRARSSAIPPGHGVSECPVKEELIVTRTQTSTLNVVCKR